MSTVKIVLRKIKKKDGKFPLAIRITKNRKSSYIYLSQTLKEDEWDAINQRVRKNHPFSVRLNNFILKKHSEANDKLLESESVNPAFSSQLVKKQLLPNVGNNFFNVATEYLNNFKTSGKYNRYQPDKSRIKRFNEFLEGKQLSFNEITISLLERFKSWLKGKHKASDRSIVNHLIIIRTIFNIALKNNAIDSRTYPFGKNKIQIKIPESMKLGLSIEEVVRIEELDLSQRPILNHCRNIWLFSLYFAGMRISDVLRIRWDDFHDLRLKYKMGKNAKSISLSIPEKALAIVEQYKPSKDKSKFVFPELKTVKDHGNLFDIQRRIAHSNKRINKGLKQIADLAKINKKLSMHIARHTFGNISGDRISIQMLQKLYRHSSITTTIGYQANFIYKDTDEALKKVLDF